MTAKFTVTDAHNLGFRSNNELDMGTVAALFTAKYRLARQSSFVLDGRREDELLLLYFN